MQKITILLATYNGERFLAEQMESLAGQDVEGQLDIVVSDDGSSDATLAMIEDWRQRWQRGSFTVRRGPARGFAENFRFLLQTPGIADGYVAFCDQDDIWDADKLRVAVGTIGNLPGPSLYGSRTRLVDVEGKAYGQSPLFARSPGFRNAIVQSLAGGNTMVLNAEAAALMAESCRRTGFIAHDWWSYLMVTGAGGRAIYDPVPHIAYRQHGSNLIGDKGGIRAKLKRLGMGLQGRFSTWNESNLAGLDACADLLSDESRRIIAEFRAARQKHGIGALAGLLRARIYRQTKRGSFALWVAALLGKV